MSGIPKSLTVGIAVWATAFAASATSNSIHDRTGFWINPQIGIAGSANVQWVDVRLSFLDFPPPPLPSPPSKVWIEIDTVAVPVGPWGEWRVTFDVLDYPGYLGSIDCPPIVTGWELGQYRAELLVDGRVEDTSRFSVFHDCLIEPELLDPPPPPSLPSGPSGPPAPFGAD